MKKIYSVWIEDSDEANEEYLETKEEAMGLCEFLKNKGYNSTIEEIDQDTMETLAWYDGKGNLI